MLPTRYQGRSNMRQVSAHRTPLGWRIAFCAAIIAALVAAPSVAGTAAAKEGPGGISTPARDNSEAAECVVSFSDVTSSHHFYDAVRHLYCIGAVNGYPDGTFRPNNNTTRGQLAKVVVVAKNWPLYNPGRPSFSDVQPDNPFYLYVETARSRNIISGYTDGTFRPGAEITRGQIAKVVALAEGWPLENPGSATFIDVAPGSAFYSYVETAARRGVLGGYNDRTFRPGNPATRGQVSKIVYNATVSPPQYTLSWEEQHTINLINGRRAAMGLPTLRTDISLSRAARRHSADIGPHGLCQHNGTDGSSPWDRIAQAGYGGAGRGEVVACNFNNMEAVVGAWWASPGHYGVLVDATVNDIGCGWWARPDGYGWVTCDTGSN